MKKEKKRNAHDLVGPSTKSSLEVAAAAAAARRRDSWICSPEPQHLVKPRQNM
jgi:hypothetical protein